MVSLKPCKLVRASFDGYSSRKARSQFTGKLVRLHIAALENKLGRALNGCACHRCDDRNCIEEEHLWEGTIGQNNRDAIKKGRYNRGIGPYNHNAKKTHCPNGHEYTPENTYVYSHGRQCKACHGVIGRKNA